MAHNQQENSNLADDFLRDAAAAAAAAETASRDSTLSWENVQQPQPTNVAAVQQDPWHGKELPQTKHQYVATGDAWRAYQPNSPSQSSQVYASTAQPSQLEQQFQQLQAMMQNLGQQMQQQQTAHATSYAAPSGMPTVTSTEPSPYGGKGKSTMTYIPQWPDKWDATTSNETARPASSGLDAGSFSQHLPPLPDTEFNKLVGDRPRNQQSQWGNQWGWYNNAPGSSPEGKDPIPKWDGTHPAQRLRPWLKELRMWRQLTVAPSWRHGHMLMQSFPEHSWMRQLSGRIPEESILTDECWEIILREILTHMKPYLDIETKVLIEQTLYGTTRENKETFASYLTRKVTKNRDLSATLGYSKTSCKSCGAPCEHKVEIPEVIWAHILERGAHLTDEQRDRMNLWDSGAKTSERLTELLLRLDRKDHLVAQALAGVKNTATHPQATFLGTSNPERLDDSVRDALGKEAGEPPSTTSEQPIGNWNYPVDYPDDYDDSSDSDFDQAYYDDDGEPLQEDGEVLIPFDPDQEYDEREAADLRTFAVTYQQVRGALQATRTGREQKTYKKLFAKGKGKGKKPPKPFRKGQPPRVKKPDKRTPYKDRVGGKSTRQTWNKFKSNIVCYKCGKKGHISANCTSSSGSGRKDGPSQKSAQSGPSNYFLHTHSSLPRRDYTDTYFIHVSSLGGEGSPGVWYVGTSSGCIESCGFYPFFAGLSISVGHGLLDTGAQGPVIGVIRWQQWAKALALFFGLRPVFSSKLQLGGSAGGVGGESRIIGVCEMPMGIGGVSSSMEWQICEDPNPSHPVPPLIPITYIRDADCLIDVNNRKMTQRACNNKVAELVDLDTGHQSTSMMNFGT